MGSGTGCACAVACSMCVKCPCRTMLEHAMHAFCGVRHACVMSAVCELSYCDVSLIRARSSCPCFMSPLKVVLKYGFSSKRTPARNAPPACQYRVSWPHRVYHPTHVAARDVVWASAAHRSPSPTDRRAREHPLVAGAREFDGPVSFPGETRSRRTPARLLDAIRPPPMVRRAWALSHRRFTRSKGTPLFVRRVGGRVAAERDRAN